MIDILAIENGVRGGFSPEERLPDPADIMVICSSLISLNAINEEDHGSLRSVNQTHGPQFQVQLAHFSVKEFLLSDRCAFHLDFRSQICHSVIAESCLHYLLHMCQDGPITKELVSQYPLSLYAAKQWCQHLRTIADLCDDSIVDLASQLLTKEDSSLLSWVQLYNMDRPWQGFDSSIQAKDLAEPLYYAARIGVPAVIEKILGRRIDVNAQGGRYGNALQAASCGGNETAVKMLLDAGADVNALGGRYGNAIYAASLCGYRNIAKMLLNAGADVNAPGGQYSTALCVASDRGHEAVVELLLETGADTNTPGGPYGNALQAASLRGHGTVVMMLLKAGADVNAQGGEYGNALHAAASRGHGMVVKILLDAGADVNARGGEYGNALQAALDRGHEKVVKMLLDAGANANTQGLLGS